MKRAERRTYATAGLDKLAEGELGYIAGMLDGEGSIGIYQTTTRNRYGVYENALVRCTVTNTCVEVIEWLVRRVPGSRAYRYRNSEGKPNRRPCSRMCVDGLFAALLLERVLPYLVIKHRIAELAMEFYAGMEHNGGRPVIEAERTRRRKLVLEFEQVRAGMSLHRRAELGRLRA